MLAEREPVPHSGDAIHNTLLFEVAWEVCNQVGGIYTVLRSKADFMMRTWDEHYCLVGPYIPEKAATDFEPGVPSGIYKEILTALEREGVRAWYGHWLVAGKPQAILLEPTATRERMNQLKHQLWQQYGVESPPNNALIDNAISFGHVVSRLTAAACRLWVVRGTGQRVITHFHEWQGGVGLPLAHREGQPLITLFTTHATLLGRYIASSSDDLYQRLKSVDVDKEARHFGIQPQHRLEAACAQAATVFTTVSPITGEECAHLLGRKPDVVTPNGINAERYDVGHDFQNLHARYKEGIRRFVIGHFFPSYAFDLDNTLFFFTSGRFEPHNKGFDLSLEALARLNTELKNSNLKVSVVFFIVTDQPVHSLNPHALRDRGVLEELRLVSREIGDMLAEQLFLRGAAAEDVKLDELADEYWMVRYRRTRYAFKSNRLPFITTHVLQNEATDPVLRKIQQLGLNNAKDDPVKIVYHPQFINSVNPLWHMEYEHFVRGCHLGIFPSSYEPWGYTPLECVCMGVPAITSDLSGFGRYLADVHPDHDRHGITVLGRREQDFGASARELANRLLAFCRLNRRQRIALRNAVEAHSHSFDWDRLGHAYHRAHHLAMERQGALP
ncbi:MAG TPA: glycosyltransferase [Polyangiaceae bacterium]|jgi:glycogen(starch) synthase|nr:glycosyltransferase [Polyangiaceae bacterium]